MRLAGELKHSSVNGPGIRYVVFFQGCPHSCPGCQNPETHDPKGGEKISSAEIAKRIEQTRFLDGVTLSGGDPFMQPKACQALASAAKRLGLNVWAYTGWRFEELLEDPEKADALKDIDVLVDGPFIQKLKSEECLWRGSTNQRLIDVQASLKAGQTIIYENNYHL